jgi:hypothetical protein
MCIVITEKNPQALFLKCSSNQRIKLQCRTKTSAFFTFKLELRRKTRQISPFCPLYVEAQEVLFSITYFKNGLPLAVEIKNSYG